MRRLLSVLLLASAFGCGKPLPEFRDFDLEFWKKDKNACGDYRSGHIDALKSQQEKLLALDESEIITLLGRPDLNELYKRNQKFYHYYLEPGESCEHAKPGAKRLVIRFNAMGLAKEVSIE